MLPHALPLMIQSVSSFTRLRHRRRRHDIQLSLEGMMHNATIYRVLLYALNHLCVPPTISESI